MVSIYYNHIKVAGCADRLREFQRWCGINERMVDADDGASDAAQFDESTNYRNHQRFIEFIKTHTATRIDRIRLHTCVEGGLLICLDSWRVRFGVQTHWMAENFPDLLFDAKLIQDGYSCWKVVFEQGKWIEMFHIAPAPQRPRRWMRRIRRLNAVGYYGEYSGPYFGPTLDVDSIEDDGLRELASRYRDDGRTDYERGRRRFFERSVAVDEIGQRYEKGIVTFRLANRWGIGYVSDAIEDYDTHSLVTDHLPPGRTVPVAVAFEDPDIFVGFEGGGTVGIGRRGENWELYDAWGSCIGVFPTKESALEEAKQIFGPLFHEAAKEPAE